jgi:hypothetical protein
MPVFGAVLLLVEVRAAAARPERAPFEIASVSDQARAKAAEVQGERAEADRRFADAAADYQRAWDLSGDPRLLLRLSVAYEAAGDLVKALEALDWYRARAPRADAGDLRERRDRLAAALVASEG